MSAPLAARRPPGPPPRGQLDRLRVGYHLLTDPLGFVARHFEDYGPVFASEEDGGLHFVVRKPEHAWEVLVRDRSKYDKSHPALRQLELVTGRGLITTDGDVWRRQRRLVQPAFSQKRLADYAQVMVDEAARTAEAWHPHDVVELKQELMELTMRVVCRTLFSVDLRGETASLRPPLIAIKRAMGVPGLIPEWLPFSPPRRMRRARREIDAFMDRFLVERRTGRERRSDLLQALVEATGPSGDRLEDREVRDQLMTMFFAGHDTNANALAWTAYFLGRHPAAANRLHAEVDAVLGDRDPTLADLEALSWTRQCFEEAMRLCPPAFCIFRRAAEDTTVGGYDVPAGSELDVWVYFTHRDPRCFPEPESFRPERFDPERVARLPRCAYIPFGAGARACIGKTFTMLEGPLVLATLARRFRLVPVTNRPTRPRIEVTLAPGPLETRLVPR